MRFHVVSLPHTQTTSDYLSCAYTQKVIKFCKMMKDLGHYVILYGGFDNHASCDEFVQTTQAYTPHTHDYTSFPFEINHPVWKEMNRQTIKAIKTRKQPKDFICLIAGLCQKEIADAFPDMMSVEYGIGYGGVFSSYKVFESYAWMHTVYGSMKANSHSVDGRFYDAVIPNYFDVSEFKFSDTPDDYFLYMGRLVDRKGWKLCQDICKHIGKRLIVAGQGEFSGYGEYVGVVGREKRAQLLSQAQAIFCPTLYIEPFGGVAIEAMLSGTPVISTDWGAFTETIKHGLNGFRCRTFQEFIDAANGAHLLNRTYIHDYAKTHYSLGVIKYDYQEYFERLLTLYDKGFYTLT